MFNSKLSNLKKLFTVDYFTFKARFPRSELQSSRARIPTPLAVVDLASDVLLSARSAKTKGVSRWTLALTHSRHRRPTPTDPLAFGGVDLVASPRASGTTDQGNWMLEISSGIRPQPFGVFSSFVSLALLLVFKKFAFGWIFMMWFCCCYSFLVGSRTVEGVDSVPDAAERRSIVGGKENCPKESRARVLSVKNLFQNNKFPLPSIGGSFFTRYVVTGFYFVKT